MKALLQDGLQVHVLAPSEKRLLNNLVGDSSLAEELALLRGALVGWMKHTGDSLPVDFSSVIQG